MMGVLSWKVEAINTSAPLVSTATNYSGFDSLDQVSQALPQGVYSTLRTYFGSGVVDLDNHIGRLVESARLSGYNLAINPEGMRTSLRQVLFSALLNNHDYRLRLTSAASLIDMIYISAEPLHSIPDSCYRRGVRVITQSFHRDNPRAKSTGFISVARVVRQSLPADIHEVIMLDEQGNYLEGMSSNFFCVLSNNEIWTAEEGILVGTTRQMVIEALRNQVIKVNFGSIHKDSPIVEAFITSVSRGVLPICQIDERVLEAPGPITKEVMKIFDNLLREKIEIL